MNNYVAYCFDEAVVFFGLQLESMLDEAGQKPDKESKRVEAAQTRILNRIFGDEKAGSGYADPAAMFG